MSGVSIKMKGRSLRSINEMTEALMDELNAELVCKSLQSIDFVKISILSFEKYFFRNGSYASLTIVLTENNDEKTADIIGSGGGEGFFNISWGANQEMVANAERILKIYGLRTVS